MSGSSAGDLVSVVIATYNMGRYLPQAVQSVLGQSYANLDLQIVDDGSTDDTPSILRRWDGHPRVRTYSQANAGKARAMNQGVALSGGSFVAGRRATMLSRSPAGPLLGCAALARPALAW